MMTPKERNETTMQNFSSDSIASQKHAMTQSSVGLIPVGMGQVATYKVYVLSTCNHLTKECMVAPCLHHLFYSFLADTKEGESSLRQRVPMKGRAHVDQAAIQAWDELASASAAAAAAAVVVAAAAAAADTGFAAFGAVAAAGTDAEATVVGGLRLDSAAVDSAHVAAGKTGIAAAFAEGLTGPGPETAVPGHPLSAEA
jgi:hypothetical protein